MNFAEVIAAINEGKRVRRSWWHEREWVRLIDLYSDREFRVVEHEPCDGTWCPFMIRHNDVNSLRPWTPEQEDVMADDWEVVDG